MEYFLQLIAETTYIIFAGADTLLSSLAGIDMFGTNLYIITLAIIFARIFLVMIYDISGHDQEIADEILDDDAQNDLADSVDDDINVIDDDINDIFDGGSLG